MSLTKSILLIAAFLILAASALAQAGRASSSSAGDASAVEIKEDRFGGGRIVTLKPQTLLDEVEHKLTMSAESKKRVNEPGTGIASIDDRISLDFISLSAESSDFGDREVRFLVDGKPVDGGRAAYRIYQTRDPERPALKSGKQLITVFPLARLKEISQGSKVEMRLGPFELTLPDEVLANLRRFVVAAATTSGSSLGPR